MSFGAWFAVVFICVFLLAMTWFFVTAGIAKDKNK